MSLLGMANEGHRAGRGPRVASAARSVSGVGRRDADARRRGGARSSGSPAAGGGADAALARAGLGPPRWCGGLRGAGPVGRLGGGGEVVEDSASLMTLS